MQIKKRLSCAVGNVFNDLYRQLLHSFELLFFMKVVELSASEAGLMLFIGQIADAVFSPITGYLGDHVNIPFLSKRIGRRKSWHFLATVLMAVALPLLFNQCFLCNGSYQSWLPLVYFGFFSALVNICFNVVEINHMAIITTVAESVEECAALSSIRTVFSFLSGVYIYAVAWGLLGQDSESAFGPNNLSEFAYLSWIGAGTGVFFATVFLIGTKEPLARARRKSTFSGIMNAPGIFVLPHFGRKSANQEEEEQPKFTVDIDDEVSLGSECERYLTHEDNYKKEEIKIFQNDETQNMYNNNEDGKAPTEEEEKEDDEEKSIRAIPETSVDSKRRQRKHTIVNTSLNDDNSLFNLGFSVDERTQKRSSFFERTEEETIQKESAQKYVEQEFSKNKNIASYEGNDNSSALDDNPDLESLPVPLDKFPSGGKRPKRVKDWLRDPNLYKVAIIFTCSRLAQDSVYGYLPLFLTERLLFAKEAIAYFPVMLLISASFSSSICNGLNRKIGSKWSYLLAGSIVLGCAVWSYFQTLSTRHSTYAQVIVMGSGLSIMQVMALVFITELIGENKETSGSVFAIITVIARLSSGGLVIGIQKFYPEERTSSNDAVSNYVRYVFAMAPGILTLVGSLLVLLYQPSNVSYKRKGPQDVEAQAVQSLSNVQVPGCPSESEATSNVSLEANQRSSLATVYSCSEDTKLLFVQKYFFTRR